VRRICAVAAAVLIVVAAPVASAATVPVSITASGFVPATVTATTADTLQFKNDDTVVHQVEFKPTRAATCSPNPATIPPHLTLQPGQIGTCTFFTAASYLTFADPAVTGTNFQGTLTLTPPDTLTLFAEPLVVVYAGKVTLTGELSSKKSGVDVALLAKPCGRAAATRASIVQTTAGGKYVAEARTAVNTVYKVQADTTTSPDVSVKVEPQLRLHRVAAHRYLLRVLAAQSFAGKYATIQRFRGGRWISVKRVRLQKHRTEALPSVISSAAFRWTSTSRQRVRAILPPIETGRCYVPGTSSEIRS
jgi:plastocyanin